MFVIELSTASSTGSLALTIGAMRSGSDGLVIAGALAAKQWIPKRARQADLGFDPAKAEALAGFLAGLVLLAASVPVAYHAFARLLFPTEHETGTAISVLCLGICVNIAIAAVILRPWSAGAPIKPVPHKVELAFVDASTARPGHSSFTLAHLAVLGQLIDAEVSAALLIGMAVADLCGWLFVDALTGLVGAFLMSVSASRIVMRDGGVLIDLRAGGA